MPEILQLNSLQESVVSNNLARRHFQIQDLKHVWGDNTLVMGIVNVTPDSFSGDGVVGIESAKNYALSQVEKGAAIIDLGAESTRPGFTPVNVEDELARLIPVIEALRQVSNCVISIDTTKPVVLKAAIAAGANLLNSIWGLTPELLDVAGELNVPVVLMHNKAKAYYEGSVVDEVLEKLQEQAKQALSIGIKPTNIILDPGLGFGKTAEHNLLVMRDLPRLVELGFPTLLGPSRKSFIGKVTEKEVDQRTYGTAAVVALAVAAGIDIVRVHDVEAMLDVVKMADSVKRGWRPGNWDKN